MLSELEAKQEKILQRVGSDVDADHLLWMPARDVAARHSTDAQWRKQIPEARGRDTDDRKQIDLVVGRDWIRIEDAAVETELHVEDGTLETSHHRALLETSRHRALHSARLGSARHRRSVR